MSDTGIQRPNWSNGITLTNETTAEDITNYIDFKINEYTKYNFKDKSLWELYQEDFDNFEVQTFKDANRPALVGLKQLLRRNGVWVFNKKSKSVPQALYNVAYEDDRTEWSDAEIQLYIDNEGSFNSYVINRRLKSRSSTLSTSPTPTPAVLNDLPTAELPSPTDVTAPSTDVTAHPTDVTAHPTDVMAPPTNVTAPSINVTAPPINATASSIKATAAVNYGRDLATLVKIYTEESKYSGEDDNFDRKLTIFNDLYNRVGIP